jgi:monofunctional glycosyltransferase
MKLLKIILLFHIGIISIIFIFCVIYRAFNPPFGALQLYRQYVYHYPVKPVEYVSLKSIPKDVRLMTLAIEDFNFYHHNGIDLDAIRNAIMINYRMKSKYSGASTINQQLARTLFLTPQKSYFRKYLEIIIAMEMDLLIPKDRILELYLNSIEWGRGIFGIERASRYYYNKDVSELSTDESIRLITILASPVKYNPDNFQTFKRMNSRYEFLRTYMNLSSDNPSNTNMLAVSVNSNLMGNMASEEEEDPDLNQTNKIAVSHGKINDVMQIQ